MSNIDFSPSYARKMRKRLIKEVMRLVKHPPEGITCLPVDENRMDILRASIRGPRDSPYEGGTFCLEITVPHNYPFYPPSVRFSTKIYHPNFNSEGLVCIGILNPADWVPCVLLEKILLSLQCLLGAPEPDESLDPECACQYVNDYDNYKKTAQDWTNNYAT